MNVGIDLDHTISEAPWFFQALVKGMRMDDHRVFVLTYRDNHEGAFEDLNNFGIMFDGLFTPPTPLKIDAPAWKAQMARELKLDLMIDDSPENLRAMPKDVTTIWFLNREVFDLKACLMGLRAFNKMEKIE